MYGPALVAFCRVVKDHVQHDLDAVGVQFLDQVLELVHLHPVLAGRRIARLGRVEADRAVAPVVHQQFAGFRVDAAVLELVEFVDRHQFDTVDAQRLQIGDFLAQAVKGARCPHARRGMPREAAHVGLIDNEVLGRDLQRGIRLPIEVIEHRLRPVPVAVIPIGLLAPDVASANHLGVGIHQDLAGVEAVALVGRERSIHTKTIFQVFGIQPEDGHGIDIADAELLEEGDFHHRLRRAFFKQHQRAGRGVPGKD